MEELVNAQVCSLCGTTLPAEATVCSHCGKLREKTLPSRATLPSKWYHNIWFVLVLLFCVLGPFGLPLVWKNPRFARWVKVALTIVVILYTMWLVDVTLKMVHAVMNEINQFNTTLQP